MKPLAWWRRGRALARLAGLFALALTGASGCRSGSEPSAAAVVDAGSAAGEPQPPRRQDHDRAREAQDAGGAHLGVQIVRAPSEGTVETLVREALARASAAPGQPRTLVVYVGAAWCEPCQRFHHAAERGELDADFPTMTLLEFDLDRDRERLADAGYLSKYIPLFALPARSGAASGKQIEGGIKGDHAVGFIVPRLKEMLSE